MSGAADAAIVSAEDRYQAVEQGMKDFMYVGGELEISWGTIATSDRFLKETAQADVGLCPCGDESISYFRSP